jgi:hypothetical protein
MPIKHVRRTSTFKWHACLLKRPFKGLKVPHTQHSNGTHAFSKGIVRPSKGLVRP